jgi:hypothetical protein
MKERNASIVAENEQLRGQLSVKYETGESHKNSAYVAQVQL